MRTTTTKTARTTRTPRMAVKPEDRLFKDTWSDIGRQEGAVVRAATKVIETVPAPVDVIDSAIAFAARTLKAQREALVPLLESVTPRVTSRRSVPTAAEAVASAYGLAERVLETQRTVLHGLVETVTPPLARHAAKRGGPATARTRVAVRRSTPRVAAKKKATRH